MAPSLPAERSQWAANEQTRAKKATLPRPPSTRSTSQTRVSARRIRVAKAHTVGIDAGNSLAQDNAQQDLSEVVQGMNSKARNEALFDAVLSENEEMIVALTSQGGVSLDIVRKNRITQELETPRQVAEKAEKTNSIAVIERVLQHRRQQAICVALIAKYEVLEHLLQRHSAQAELSRQLERPPLPGGHRPWRDDAALAQCCQMIARLNPNNKIEIARALCRRSKLYLSAHCYEHAIEDYSAILELCASDSNADKAFRSNTGQANLQNEQQINLYCGTIEESQEVSHRIPEQQVQHTNRVDNRLRSEDHYNMSQMQEGNGTEDDPEDDFEKCREQLVLNTLLRRGLAYKTMGNLTLSLSDLEVGLRMFSAKRATLLVVGTRLQATRLIDRGKQALSELKFQLSIKNINNTQPRSAGFAGSTHLRETMENMTLELAQLNDELNVVQMEEEHSRANLGLSHTQSALNRIMKARNSLQMRKSMMENKLAEADKLLKKGGPPDAKRHWKLLKIEHTQTTAARGVSLIWLIEWAIRSELHLGHAQWLLRSTKGKRLVAQLVDSGLTAHAARRSLAAAVCGDLSGPLVTSKDEGKVICTNHNRSRILVAVGIHQFWYGADDLSQLPLSESDIRTKFEIIDEDSSGFLDRAEVGAVAASLGSDLTEPELSKAMEAMDTDGGGEVSFQEFKAWFDATMNDPASGGVRFLNFSPGDRVTIKPEAAARLKRQELLPTLIEKAHAWAKDHRHDNNFDQPVDWVATASIADIVDKVVKPATSSTERSFAEDHLRRPILKPATHCVVVSRSTPFWEMIHGLLSHSLGSLEDSLNLIQSTPAQIVQSLIRRARRSVQPVYYIDWLLEPHHPRLSVAASRKKTAVAAAVRRSVASCVVIPHFSSRQTKQAGVSNSLLQSHMQIPEAEILRDPCAIVKIAQALDAKKGKLDICLGFQALDQLSAQLWLALAQERRSKNSLSVVFATPGAPMCAEAPLLRAEVEPVEDIVNRRRQVSASLKQHRHALQTRACSIWHAELNGTTEPEEEPLHRRAPSPTSASASNSADDPATNNSPASQGGVSRFRGVSWDSKSCGWRAELMLNGNSKALGIFEDEMAAARAYDAAAKLERGDTARLNFPGTKTPRKLKIVDVAPQLESVKAAVSHETSFQQGYQGRATELGPIVARVLGKHECLVTPQILKESIARVEETHSIQKICAENSVGKTAFESNSAEAQQPTAMFTNASIGTPPHTPSSSNTAVLDAKLSTGQTPSFQNSATSAVEQSDRKLPLVAEQSTTELKAYRAGSKVVGTARDMIRIGGSRQFAALCAVVEEHSALAVSHQRRNNAVLHDKNASSEYEGLSKYLVRQLRAKHKRDTAAAAQNENQLQTARKALEIAEARLQLLTCGSTAGSKVQSRKAAVGHKMEQAMVDGHDQSSFSSEAAKAWPSDLRAAHAAFESAQQAYSRCLSAVRKQVLDIRLQGAVDVKAARSKVDIMKSEVVKQQLTQRVEQAATKTKSIASSNSLGGSRHIGAILSVLLDTWQKAFVGLVNSSESTHTKTDSVNMHKTKVYTNTLESSCTRTQARKAQHAVNESLQGQRAGLLQWIRSQTA